LKISVFTPFYYTGVPYIGAAYESLCAQTYQDWEWIILRNGQGAALPEVILKDPRVKVIKAQTTNGFIGALKREACSHCSGDILLELDHDDLLSYDAMAHVVNEMSGGADFVYSDFAEFKDGTWEPNVYGSQYGWEFYPVTFQGHQLAAMKAPPATPHNLRRIEFAPNHLRAWRREFYEQLAGRGYDRHDDKGKLIYKGEPFVGGHDASLQYADDHDLVVRTYLDGGRIVHVPECLYFYRVHAKQNTNGNVGNKLIQELDAKVYDRYIYRLAERFANGTWGEHHTFSFLTKIDLCGAHDCPEGYVSLDCVEAPGGIVADLNGPWPLSDNSVGVIRAHDAIEHLRDPIHVMNEAYRVLAPGGFFLIMVPSTSGPGAWCDPTHASFWNHLSWRYYTDRNFAKYIPAFKGRFQLSDSSTTGGPISYERAGLIALKPGYEPMGKVLI
jgi:O-antigen biosynthesis protein